MQLTKSQALKSVSLAVSQMILLASAILLLSPLQAEKKALPSEPRALYIYPVGGQRGAVTEVQIKGQTLQGTYAVWTDCDALRGRVKRIEEIDEAGNSAFVIGAVPLSHRITVEVEIAADAELGGHSLRLVSPRGVSDPLPFRVSSELEPLIGEDASRTGPGRPTQGQPLEYPVAVNGLIGRSLGGEVDHYGFDVDAGRELYFEVFFPARGPGPIRKMLLYLYRHEPSWVDPHRLRRLAFNDDPIVHAAGLFAEHGTVRRASLKHRFADSGRYLIAVKGFDDRGGPDFVYQLRMVDAEGDKFSADRSSWPLAHSDPYAWFERRFQVQLSSARLQELSKRTVLQAGGATEKEGVTGSAGASSGAGVDDAAGPTPEPDSPGAVSTHRFGGTSEKVPEPALLTLPAMVEGVIDSPGKADRVRFAASAGQAVAVEVETPRDTVPTFVPWVQVLDREQEVVFSAIYNRVTGNNVMLFRELESKMIYTFDRGGEYTLQIRELTTAHAGSDFAYRVLIRPQIPHVGQLKVEPDRLNLVPGQASRLTVTVDREEKFEGEVALVVEDLPEGVHAYATAVPEPERPPAFDESEKHMFRPETQTVSITLMAEDGASTTNLPRMVRVKARAIVGGKMGPLIPVGQVPLMVVAPPQT